MKQSEFAVEIEKAIGLLGKKKQIHTYRQAGLVLIGANWGRDELIAHMRKWGVEESGEEASAMGHTLVVIDNAGPLWIEAGKPMSDAEAIAVVKAVAKGEK